MKVSSGLVVPTGCKRQKQRGKKNTAKDANRGKKKCCERKEKEVR